MRSLAARPTPTPGFTFGFFSIANLKEGLEDHTEAKVLCLEDETAATFAGFRQFHEEAWIDEQEGQDSGSVSRRSATRLRRPPSQPPSSLSRADSEVSSIERRSIGIARHLVRTNGSSDMCRFLDTYFR
jgi:hypothetical protein